MIARENSQATRIDRKGSMEAEIGRKIGDGFFGKVGKLPRKPFVAPPRGSIQSLHRDFVLTKKIGIASSRRQPRRFDIVQKLDRIVLRVFPKIGIEPLEEKAGAVVPAPFQVVGKFLEAFNPLRNLGKPSYQHPLLQTRNLPQTKQRSKLWIK